MSNREICWGWVQSRHKQFPQSDVDQFKQAIQDPKFRSGLWVVLMIGQDEVRRVKRDEKRDQAERYRRDGRYRDWITKRVAGNKRTRRLPYRLIAESINRRMREVGCGTEKIGCNVFKLCGYTIRDLLKHLESKFTEGMNWGNYGIGDGKWNIDHVRPCASFEFSKPGELKKCFSLDNIQPLWSRDNDRKSAHYQGEFYSRRWRKDLPTRKNAIH